MQTPRLYFSHFVLLLICYQVSRKLERSNDALVFLRENEIYSTDFAKSEKLLSVLDSFNEPPAILLLNKHALNITLNFLCNIKHFPDTLDRVLIVAFDLSSYETINVSFPSVKNIHYDVTALHQRFSVTDGRYQLFQLFRARLCAFLAQYFAQTKTVSGFWMIQSDTIWRTDFFKTFTLDRFQDADLIFDSEGKTGLLSKMIAGGYFYVKSSFKNFKFFNKISNTLTTYYVTDNNIMGKLCLEEFAGVNCKKMSYDKIVNWRWRPDADINSTDIPLFFQFDGGAGAESKFQALSKVGADFVAVQSLTNNVSTLQCNMQAVSNNVLVNTNFINAAKADKASIIIRFFHSIVEFVCSIFPLFEHFALTKVFPFWAYYLVV